MFKPAHCGPNGVLNIEVSLYSTSHCSLMQWCPLCRGFTVHSPVHGVVLIPGALTYTCPHEQILMV